jgi:glycosyltransferase involved in cell wall biosynthesis
MHTADVIVSPLTGRALIEAALSGTPVVAYDVEWHRELIRNHDTGLLVPYRDYAAMATAILWVFDHPGEAGTLGAHARAAALEQFHPRKLLREEIACFERVLQDEI